MQVAILKAFPCLLILLLCLPAWAQNAPVQRKRIMPSGQHTGSSQPIHNYNYVVKLSGSIIEGFPIDLTMTCADREIHVERYDRESKTITTCKFSVWPIEPGLKVHYQISMSIPVTTGDENKKSAHYRDVGLSGSVVCEDGVPVVLLKSGSNSLSLTVTPQPPPSGGDASN